MSRDLYDANLPLIDEAIDIVCAKRGLRQDECEELRQEVHLALLEDDCARLARFQRQSSLRTFLVTVVAGIFIDLLRREKGRWRPSAPARRLGPGAMLLERLKRDGYSRDEAIRIVRQEPWVHETARELVDFWERFPDRPPRVFETDEHLADAASGDDVQGRVREREREELCGRVRIAIQRARKAMGAEDRLILDWIFGEDRSIADVGRALGLEQKPLYRRRDHLLARLRHEIEAEGLGWEEVRQLMGWPELTLAEMDNGEDH